MSTDKHTLRFKEHPVIILVGTSGTGKSSLTNNLANHFNDEIEILPNRRELTDMYIISAQKKMPQGNTLTRWDKYPILKDYREKKPEGIAGILLDIPLGNQAYHLFDGLRGIAEISYALDRFKNAHFIGLNASVSTRLHRLILRNESHDKSTEKISEVTSEMLDFLSDHLETNDLISLQKKAISGEISVKTLSDAVKILKKENDEYQPDKTMHLLKANGTDKKIVIETDQLTCAEVAKVAIDTVNQWMKQRLEE